MTSWYHKLKALFSYRSIEQLFDDMIALGEEPPKIARSLAIGVAIGLVIPVGLQSVASIPIAIFFRCNLILTLVGSLISNPLTLVPLYFIAYEIGTAITGITLSYSEIEAMIVNMDIDYFVRLGSDAIIVLITGTAIQALIYGAITYATVNKLIDYYIKKKQKRIAASGEQD